MNAVLGAPTSRPVSQPKILAAMSTGSAYELKLAKLAELYWLNELSKRGAAFVPFPPRERGEVGRGRGAN